MTDEKLEILLTAKNTADAAFNRMEGQLASITKKVFSFNSALAVGAAATSFGLITAKAIDATAEIKRNAEMAGVSTTAYQELAFAAEQYQITNDGLRDSLKELNLRADEFIQTAAGPAAEAFQRLGFSQKDLNARLADAPALLEEITDRMQGLDRAAQIRIADEIFGGEGGEQFVAMIRAGSGELGRLRDRARELGVVIDSGLVDSSVRAKAEIASLTSTLSANFQKTIVSLAPTITEVAGAMSDWVAQNGAALSQDIAGWTARFAEETWNLARAAAKAAGHLKEIGEYGFSFSHDREELLRQASDYVGRGLVDVKTVLSATDAQLVQLLERLRAVDAGLARVGENGQILYKIGPNTTGWDEYLKSSFEIPPAIKPLSQLPESANVPTPPPFSSAYGGNDAAWILTTGPGSDAEQAYREIEEMIQRRNEMMANGNQELIDLTQHTAELMQENFSGFFYDAVTGQMDSFRDYMEGFFDSITRAWSDMMGKMASEWIFGNGKSIGGGLLEWLNGLGGGSAGGTYVPGAWGANGLVFNQDGIKWHARGGILTAPTILPLRDGSWVGGGEAGYEAIMPLRRSASGRLGVEVAGGGMTVVHNVYNNTGAEVKTRERQGPGGLEIDVIIDNMVANKLAQRGSASNRALLQLGGSAPLIQR